MRIGTLLLVVIVMIHFGAKTAASAADGPGSNRITGDAERPQTKWLEDYDVALQEAKSRGVAILLLSTNSHSCSYCIKLEKAVFSTPAFADFARNEVVLFKVDYAEVFRHGIKPVSAGVKQVRARTKIPAEIRETTGWPYIALIAPSGQIIHGETERERLDAGAFIGKYRRLLRK